MLCRLLPAQAAPVLSLALNKIARTPRPRLAVGYRLICRAGCPPFAALCAPRRSLGASLLVDRLLMGGIVGETLPLCVQRSLAQRVPAEAIGEAVDLLA